LCGGGEAAHLDAIQGHAARTAGDGYADVTVKAMAIAMEGIPRVDIVGRVGRTFADGVGHQEGDLGLSVTLRWPGDDGGEGGLR